MEMPNIWSFHASYENLALLFELFQAWRSWNERTPLNLVDAILLSVSSRQEMIRCIHIALLCVQEDAARRPTMATVVLMLSSHTVSLPLPLRPAYFSHSSIDMEPEVSPNPEATMAGESVNEVSFSDQGPRWWYTQAPKLITRFGKIWLWRSLHNHQVFSFHSLVWHESWTAICI